MKDSLSASAPWSLPRPRAFRHGHAPESFWEHSCYVPGCPKPSQVAPRQSRKASRWPPRGVQSVLRRFPIVFRASNLVRTAFATFFIVLSCRLKPLLAAFCSFRTLAAAHVCTQRKCSPNQHLRPPKMETGCLSERLDRAKIS
jgi:hypothetical protein